MNRSLKEIALDIKSSWKDITSEAEMCCDIMIRMKEMQEKYGHLPIFTIKTFLRHAKTWRGKASWDLKDELEEYLKMRTP